MKLPKNKNKMILPVVAIASFALSTLTFAGAPASSAGGAPTTSNSGVIAAINHVGNEMVALATAGVTAVDSAMYQFDQNLLTILKANTASTTVSSQVPKNTQRATNSYIKNTLQVLPNHLASTSDSMINAAAIKNENEKDANRINALTMDVPGSDTLYSNNPAVIEAQFTNGSNYYIGPPKTTYDNDFNIASITAPMAYTSSQLTATTDYLAYLTQSYNNPANAVNFSTLQTKLQAMSPKKQYSELYNIISGQNKLGQAYQQYQLALRSNIATQSVALDNFNYLIAERTPSKTAVSGIKNSQGKTIRHPSELQVEAYQANHRADNPAWIKGLQSKTSTTLQREEVVLLAQIAHQNYQAHLDREKILTSLSAMELQSGMAGKLLLRTKSETLNRQIKDFGKSSSRNHSGDSQTAEKIAQQDSSQSNAAQKRAAAKARNKAKQRENS